jgi:hypothetical protein
LEKIDLEKVVSNGKPKIEVVPAKQRLEQLELEIYNILLDISVLYAKIANFGRFG